jgi:hypothetical protein
MELINRFIKHTIESYQNLFAPRCKCARNKPSKITQIKNGLLGIRSGKRNDRSCSSFINVFKRKYD